MGDYLSSDLLTRALFTSENWVIMTSNEATSVRNEPEPVWLTESDIPGAKLTHPINSYTVTELKWWLLCRGVKSADLMEQETTHFKVYYCTM